MPLGSPLRKRMTGSQLNRRFLHVLTNPLDDASEGKAAACIVEEGDIVRETELLADPLYVECGDIGWNTVVHRDRYVAETAQRYCILSTLASGRDVLSTRQVYP